MDFLDLLPDDLRQQLRDGVVNFLADHAEKIAGDKTARAIRQLSSQAPFNNAFDQSMKKAVRRFSDEYTTQDEDLVEVIITDGNFWQSKDVRQALMTMVRQPGSWLTDEREIVVRHFADVLPRRINRERVDKAVTFFLRCVLEELWTLPGVSEIREIYNLQFQKIGTEAARQQVALLEAQLQAMSQLSTDVRQALVQLATMFEKRLLAAPPLQSSQSHVLPYHNLPQPDYTTFVGRQTELDWLHKRLAPSDRTWQIAIVGIGGVGKTALALAIAHDYREHYEQLQLQERFEAIIWITAKEEVLTITGRKKSTLSTLISHSLEDIYTVIAQTLEREDITRAILEEQDYLVQKALSAQRTLLIVDNIESVSDERVRIFLRNLPVPTKCIITSREWVDVTDVWRLTGLPAEEAEKMISEEATARSVLLNEEQQRRLFERTSGLPLPIKLSVARIASGETFDQVIRWLGNATGDLPEYCIKGQIDIAYQFDPNAWKLLFTCWLFDRSAGASREALGTIADLSLADRDNGLTLLQRLFLLNRDESDRFWMLPIVQRYLEAEFINTDFSEELIECWLDWLLEFTQNYSIDLELHIEKVRIVSSEYPNLLNAIRWCYEHKRWETLLRLAERIWFYPYLTGLLGEVREILESAIHAAKALHEEQQAGRFMRHLARLLRVQGDYEKALVECLDKAEEIALRYKDDAEQGWIYHIRSDILLHQGQQQEAEQLALTMLEIGERLKLSEIKFLAVQQLSIIESKKQHFDKALEWLDQGDEWAREIGWSRGMAWNTYCRGTILIQRGAATDAEQYLMESLRMATSWNERRLIAYNEQHLAQAYAETGRLHLAHRFAEDALDLYERLGAVELEETKELLQKVSGGAANK